MQIPFTITEMLALCFTCFFAGFLLAMLFHNSMAIFAKIRKEKQQQAQRNFLANKRRELKRQKEGSSKYSLYREYERKAAENLVTAIALIPINLSTENSLKAIAKIAHDYGNFSLTHHKRKELYQEVISLLSADINAEAKQHLRQFISFAEMITENKGSFLQ